MVRKNQISRVVSLDRHDRAVTHLNRTSITDGEIGISDQIKEASKFQIVADACPILNKDVMVSEAFCNKHLAAVQIQSYFRGGLLRRQFLSLRVAAIIIQKNIRMLRCWKEHKHYKNEVISAIVIQSSVRGWIARREGHKHRRLIILVQVSFIGTSSDRLSWLDILDSFISFLESSIYVLKVFSISLMQIYNVIK